IVEPRRRSAANKQLDRFWLCPNPTPAQRPTPKGSHSTAQGRAAQTVKGACLLQALGYEPAFLLGGQHAPLSVSTLRPASATAQHCPAAPTPAPPRLLPALQRLDGPVLPGAGRRLPALPGRRLHPPRPL